MSGRPKGTTGNNSPLFYIYTVIFYLYYYVKKALSLEHNASIQYGLWVNQFEQHSGPLGAIN